MTIVKLRIRDEKYQLILNATGETGGWKLLPAFKKLNDDDMAYMIRPMVMKVNAKTRESTPNPRAGSEKSLYNWCVNNSLVYAEVQAELTLLYNTLTTIEDPVDEVVEVRSEVEIIEEEEINLGDEELTFEEMTIGCVVLASQFEREGLNCKPSLWVVGPSGTGKTEDMAKFKSIDLVNWTGRTTEHAWSPGRPNADVDRPRGIFERSNHRCLVVNESANFAGEKHAVKVISEMADLLTQGFITMSDPVEDYEINSDVTAIFGMTYWIHKKLQEESLGIGQRYLVMKTKNNRHGYKNSSYITRKTVKPRSWYVNLIRTASKRELSEPSEDLIKYAHEYAEMTMDACSVGINYPKTKSDAIGSGRLGDQLIYMALMRAIICNHEVSIDDVEYFLPLLANMIPNQNLWKEALKQVPDNVPVDQYEFKSVLHLSSMQIMKSVESPLNWIKFTDEWYTFLTEIKEMW